MIVCHYSDLLSHLGVKILSSFPANIRRLPDVPDVWLVSVLRPYADLDVDMLESLTRRDLD